MNADDTDLICVIRVHLRLIFSKPPSATALLCFLCTYAAYQSTAKKWQIVPAITKRCQMKWLYLIR